MEYQEKIEKIKNIIDEACEDTKVFISSLDKELPLTFNFEFKVDGMGVNISVFEYDV